MTMAEKKPATPAAPAKQEAPKTRPRRGMMVERTKAQGATRKAPAKGQINPFTKLFRKPAKNDNPFVKANVRGRAPQV